MILSTCSGQGSISIQWKCDWVITTHQFRTSGKCWQFQCFNINTKLIECKGCIIWRSSTGTLKTKINGATTSLVVIAAVNVNFVTNLAIHIGTGATKTTVAQENVLFVNKQTQGEWCRF